MPRPTAIAILMLGTGAAWASAAAHPAPAVGSTTKFMCAASQRSEVARELQRVLGRATAAQAPRAALLRVQCGRRVWKLASGTADAKSGRAARPDDRFRAGSNLKPAIAAVVLQLVEEGRLSLDEPLTRLLPSRYTAPFKDADAITVRMLLNHRSGIGEWTEIDGVAARVLSNRDHVWTPEEYIAIAAARGPKFRPGQGYAYNNTEYVLLGLIIEARTGRTWRENVRERIFRPLGISDAALPEPGVAPRLQDHMHGYMAFEGRVIDVSDVDPSMSDAAGGHAFAPTTEELARLLDALLAGRFFKRPETLKQMQDFGPASDPNTSAGLRTGYGLGLGRYRFPDGMNAVGHSGGTAGYSSLMLRIPELGVTVSGAISTDDSAAMARLGDEVRRVLLEAR